MNPAMIAAMIARPTSEDFAESLSGCLAGGVMLFHAITTLKAAGREAMPMTITASMALRRAASTTTAVPCWLEDGDLEVALQSFFDFEAAWRRDVFEIDPAEDGRDGLHDGDDLVHVFGGQAEGEGVDSGELPEDERLALHDGLGPIGPDVAEAEYGGAVGHDRHAALLDGERIRLLGILVDGHADAGHTRRVRHREIVAGLDGDLAPHLDLPAEGASGTYARIRSGAPSVTARSGSARPRRLRSSKKAVQLAVSSFVPGARCRRTFRPSSVMPQAQSTASRGSPACRRSATPSTKK